MNPLRQSLFPQNTLYPSVRRTPQPMRKTNFATTTFSPSLASLMPSSQMPRYEGRDPRHLRNLQSSQGLFPQIDSRHLSPESSLLNASSVRTPPRGTAQRDRWISRFGHPDTFGPLVAEKAYVGPPTCCTPSPKTPQKGAHVASSRRKNTPKTKTSARVLRASKEPGSDLYPRSRFLITIARKKLDIFLNWFYQWKIYVQTFCTCGFSAIERGGRVGHPWRQSALLGLCLQAALI